MQLCNTGSSQHEEMVSLEIWSSQGPGVGTSLFFHGTNLDLLRSPLLSCYKEFPRALGDLTGGQLEKFLNELDIN